MMEVIVLFVYDVYKAYEYFFVLKRYKKESMVFT